MATRTTYKTIGNGVELEMISEVYAGEPAPLDTAVNVSEGTLCVITWADREKFTEELNAVIDKYRI